MKKKVGFLTEHTPFERYSFSGTMFYMYKAIDALDDVETVLLGKDYFIESNLSIRWAKRLLRFLKKINFISSAAKLIERKLFVNFAKRDLKQHQLEYIVAPVCSSLICQLAKNSNTSPILFITDATPGFLKDFYHWEIDDKSFEVEKDCIQKSSRVIYSSDFMVSLAQKEYVINATDYKNKFNVVPFGLNMDDIPQTVFKKDFSGELNIVFVGRDWERKGGELVLNLFDELEAKGFNVHLTVIGSDPDSAKNKPNINVIPYINKSIPEQQQQYFNVLKNAHFLILPTKADCTPMVVAEANAFGVPALVSDVGGLPTIVQNGRNGYLHSESAKALDYLMTIERTFNNKENYSELSFQSRQVYETVLNWDAWAKQINVIGTSINKI
jgi:glycosyltransferase involved in cell wall biosynthesis